MKMKVTVVIPNWNGADLIEKCLDSLTKQDYPHKIIVVDNGSVDNSVSLIEKNFKNVLLLKNPENFGFTGGVNRGIRHALDNGYDAVALFNNDAHADKHWLGNLVKPLLDNTEVGISTGKLMRDDEVHIDSTGDFYTTRGIPFPRGRNTKDTGQYNNMEEVFAASGGASLYRSALLKDIGLFDDRFFAYFEDVDISFRARLAGWKVIYNPEAVAYHAVSATSSKLGSFSRYHSIKNFYFLYLKNMPLSLMFRYFPSFLYQMCRGFAAAILQRHLLVYFRALGVVIVSLPGLLLERHRIQKKARVKANAIRKWLIIGRPPISPELD